MLLTVTLADPPAGTSATDLGYLLHKHPDRAQEFSVSSGRAHVCYPEADARRCTAALLVEVDPVALVRGKEGDRRRRRTEGPLGRYVNDRPYAGSSLLAVALGQVFGTAMKGRCEARPELAATALPLRLTVPALRCRGGADLAARLFAPLGWDVEALALPLDPRRPDWGDSPYVGLTLTGTLRLADALTHLYVLLPVLDDAKHYWVATDEVDKLVRNAAGWLGTHPERELIARRYLAHRRPLAAEALSRLAEVDDTESDSLDDATAPARVPEPERGPSLATQRVDAIVAALQETGAKRIADLGCGEGRLLAALLAQPWVDQVVGADVSPRALEIAARRLRLDRMGERQRSRVTLLQSALTYRDERLAGLDAAVLSEVVEHVDPPRLPALARTVLGAARPATVVVTTPNAEYNVRWETLPAGAMRHPDHRFEWTRAQFRAWTGEVAATYGYAVRHAGVGPDDPEVGPPTQLAVLTRTGETT